MLSDEEKEALDKLSNKKNETTWDDTIRQIKREEIKDVVVTRQKYITSILNIIEKQSKEIEILNKNMNLLREQNIHLKEVYVLKTNDYIKGTNIEDELCNKKWEDKIKAKIDYLLKRYDSEEDFCSYDVLISILQSLLEKE